jgi:hypothetical protein
MRKYVLAIMGLVLLCLVAALGSATASPATVIVDSTTDVNDGDTSSISNLIATPGPDGVISLREAILAANNTAGSDYIEFNIPLADPGYMVSGIAGTWTISLTALLPPLTGGGTIIRGDTQAVNVPDNPNPNGPEIEISGVGMGSGSCLAITSANNVIRVLVINRCELSGIAISGSSATTNTISGNYIGTDVTGSSDLGNSQHGVYIFNGAQNNTIGGDTPVERNTISGNSYSGVAISQSGTDGNTISGNYIGTDKDGLIDLGNTQSGVTIAFMAQNNTIGGDTPGERNLISGNDAYGVTIYGSLTDGNTVSGNYIGTDKDGSSDLGNAYHGVYIFAGAQNNVIGGDTPGESNLISGNDQNGVQISGFETDGNTVSGNYIGTDATGLIDRGNSQDGVYIEGGAEDNTIGGDTPGESNIIAFNGLDGVEVHGAATTGNTITQNSIHSNASLGIDLHDGGNNLYPVPTVSSVDGCFTVSGTAAAGDMVEVFTGPDEEGKRYLASDLAETGDWQVVGPFNFDTYVTATATDASGNTSKFSTAAPAACYTVFLPLAMKSY